jgi:beta-N-acetylhexosaminidase
MKIRNLFFAALILLLVGCGIKGNSSDTGTRFVIEDGTQTAEYEDSTESTTKDMAELLSTMTLHEKIGQLFIVTPEQLSGGDEYDYVTAMNNAVVSNLKQYPVGGIIFFSGNITDPEQITELLGDFRTKTTVPLFLSVDEEGGSIARIANNDKFDVPRYGSMSEIGDTLDSNEAYKLGESIGTYLSKYGFNLDFAPVADVNTNPNNPVIGKRAFSSDSDVVSAMVIAEMNGLQSQNIISCLKHFPGHGDTATDSHYGSAVTYKTWDELNQCELRPFSMNADMIMAGHITTPNVTTDGLPASISYQMLTEKLRNEMNYDGVIITDSMRMAAVTDVCTSGEAAVAAIKAGADIVLMPEDLQKAYDGVESAVVSGEIAEQEIDERVLRILRLKQKYGIIK